MPAQEKFPQGSSELEALLAQALAADMQQAPRGLEDMLDLDPTAGPRPGAPPPASSPSVLDPGAFGQVLSKVLGVTAPLQNELRDFQGDLNARRDAAHPPGPTSMRAASMRERLGDTLRGIMGAAAEQPLGRVTDAAGMTNFQGAADPTAQPDPTAGGAVLDWADAPVGAAAKAVGKRAATAAALRTAEAPAQAAAGAAATSDRARRTLMQSWPQMGAALAKHGGDIALPGANRSYSTALDRLAADIHARTIGPEGGTTTYPLTGAQEVAGQSTGYMAGKYSNQSGKTKAIPLSQFTVDDVRAFIEEHADEYVKAQGKGKPLTVGTWKGVDDQGVPHVYLDVAAKHDDVRKATVAAATQKQPPGTVRRPTGEWPEAQKAIFDLENSQELPVGNLAEFVGSPEFQRRLDEMYEAGVPVMDDKNWWDLRGTDIEKVYGEERLPGVAGFLASTSNATPPVANLRSASEYIRRWIKGEPVVQPDFRIPDTAVGSLKHHLGSVTPGDYARPGLQIPFEKARVNNLEKVAAGAPETINADKMNDMFHALLGEERAVIDRRYAKLAEDPSRGIYVAGEDNVVPPVMGGTQVTPYALIENAVRTAAERRGMSLSHYSAYVWEGIGNTIKQTGELYGVKHPAHAIPPASQGFPPIFTQMVKEKAAEWGISTEEFIRRLRAGDAELLSAVLATSAGMSAFQQWQQEGQTTDSASPQTPPD